MDIAGEDATGSEQIVIGEPMKETDDAQLKADVDEIMQRVKSIMDKVEALDPGRVDEEGSGDEAP